MDKPLSRPELESALARITEGALSRRQRYGHVALVLFAAGMVAVMASLLITEPGLPTRTTVSFALMLLIGLAWVAFGLRVLRRRLPTLANREIVAARMAVVFSTMFTVGAAWIGATIGARAMTPATWMGVSMSALAVVLLLHAHQRRARLQALREQLERELSGSR